MLIQVIENAQNAVELIGCDVEGKEFKQRVKIPTRISRKYQLICQVPVTGSYAIPMTLGDPGSDLFVFEDIDRAWKTFSALLAGVSDGRADWLRQALPDSTLRRRVLEYIKGMAPNAGPTGHWIFKGQQATGLPGSLKKPTISFSPRSFQLSGARPDPKTRKGISEMLQRLYVDNYRSLINFEFRPGSLCLLLGDNGSGKTTILDVVEMLRDFISGQSAATVFSHDSLTRWQLIRNQTFEADFMIDGKIYTYSLVIEHVQHHGLSRVQQELLNLDGRPLYSFKDGEAQLYRDDHSQGPRIPLDWSRSGIGFLHTFF